MQNWFRTAKWSHRIRRMLFERISDVVVEKDLCKSESLAALSVLSASNAVVCVEATPVVLERYGPQLPARDDLRVRHEHAFGALATIDGQFAGFVWATNQAREREGVSPFLYPIVPACESVYLFDLIVPLKFRRSGVALNLMHQIFYLSACRGYKRAFFTYDASNYKMHGIVQRLRMQEVGTLHFRKRLGVSSIDLRGLEQVSGNA